MRDAVSKIELTDFDLAIYQALWEAMSTHYLTFHELPTVENYWLTVCRIVENADGTSQSEVRPEEYEALQAVARKVMYAKNDAGIDMVFQPEYYRHEIPKFIRTVRTTRVLNQHQAAIQLGIDPNGLLDQLSTVQKTSENLFTKPKFSTISDDPGLYSEKQRPVRISTGMAKFDRLLDGGLEPTKLGMITATPGTGKTNTLIHLATVGAMSGFRTLFITLELTPSEIKRRHICMAACIKGSVIKKDFNLWSNDDLGRMSIIMNPKFRSYDYFSVADLSDVRYSVREVETQIELWKQYHRDTYGTDEDCLLVCADWLDQLLPPKGMDDKSWQAVTTICSDMKFIAKRQNVGMWTATQGTREADGKAVVRMKNVSAGYHKNDALDVGCGLGRAADQLKPGIDVIDDVGIDLCITVNKNREGPLGSVELYQGPNLRFYDSRQEYENHNNAVADIVAQMPVGRPSAFLLQQAHGLHKQGGQPESTEEFTPLCQ